MIRKIFFIVLSFFYLSSLYSKDFNYKIDPPFPEKESPFLLILNFASPFNGRPIIRFNPGRIEVLSKEFERVNVRNIQNSDIYFYEIAYNLRTDDIGPYQISDLSIKIDQGPEIVSSKSISINILKEIFLGQDFVLRAEVSKNSIYEGEFLDVDYYLYSRSNIISYDLLSYPKFNGFIKRFYHPNEVTNRVILNGRDYFRSLKYSVRLFPEESGEFFIDSLKLKLKVIDNSFGTQQLKDVIIESSKEKIIVSSLPLENRPASFNSLVHPHTFKLNILSHPPYKINQPINFEFIVEGEGALEKFSTPILYFDPNLDSLDESIILKGTQRGPYEKVFKYSYIPRAPIDILDKKLSFSYFDPVSKSYFQKELRIPSLKVEGVPFNNREENIQKISEKSSDDLKIDERKLMAPIFFEQKSFANFDYFFKIGQKVFISLIILVLLSFYFLRKKNFKKIFLKSLIFKIKRNGVDYSKLSQVVCAVFENGPCSLREKILESTLTNEAKQYFLQGLDNLQTEFSQRGKQGRRMTFVKRYFDELLSQIK